MAEHLRFVVQIDFGIDVGGIDGDVSEPGADGVDVHAGAQQVRGCCVSTMYPET